MIGRRIAFTMPKMTATASRVPTLAGTLAAVSRIPSMSSVAIQTATAVITNRMMMPMGTDGVTVPPPPHPNPPILELWLPLRGFEAGSFEPQLQDRRDVGASVARGGTDQLVLDGRLGQGGPPDRPPVDEGQHVRADAGEPLGRLAEAERSAHQVRLLRPQRLEQQQRS